MVFERGFEPPTTSMSTKCSTPELPEQVIHVMNKKDENYIKEILKLFSIIFIKR